MTATPALLRWNDVLAITRGGNATPPRRVEKTPAGLLNVEFDSVPNVKDPAHPK